MWLLMIAEKFYVIFYTALNYENHSCEFSSWLNGPLMRKQVRQWFWRHIFVIRIHHVTKTMLLPAEDIYFVVLSKSSWHLHGRFCHKFRLIRTGKDENNVMERNHCQWFSLLVLITQNSNMAPRLSDKLLYLVLFSFVSRLLYIHTCI